MSKLIDQIVENYSQLKYGLLDAQTFDPDHYGFPAIYYKIMETDHVRVKGYTDAFKKYNNFKGATVCEAGVGTLALTQHYLPYVKKAYLIENNPNVIDFIKSELDKNGWSSKVELIVGDAMKLELPEQVDYIVGELMSIYCANEYQVQIFRHLRQFLKPDGKLLPEHILNLVQLGHIDFDENVKHYPIMFTRHLPMLMSNQELVNRIDLYNETEDKVAVTISLKAMLSGTINCAYMSSWVQVAEGANFTGTDSLMPPTIIKLENSVEVKAGEELKLKIVFEYGTSLDQAVFELV